LRRIRSEAEDPGRRRPKHTRERLALIRATLNRQFRGPGDFRIKSLIPREVPAMLDESCTNNAYCLGRLFAVLEDLQRVAVGSRNATITDRFYGAASATPAVVFASLLRKAQNHLGSLRKKNERWARGIDKQIRTICALLDPADAFPSAMPLEEQGLFALGYYHQKAWRRPKKGDATDEAEQVASAPSQS
jgi:CRISPR-associated protein Csd1